jgi:hypothetical protein
MPAKGTRIRVSQINILMLSITILTMNYDIFRLTIRRVTKELERIDHMLYYG